MSVLEQVRTEGFAEGFIEGFSKCVKSQIATLRKIAGSEAVLPFERRFETANSVDEFKRLSEDIVNAVDQYL